MTDLGRLSVSLTKHGAHKVARLLRQYPSSEILSKLEGAVPGVNINEAQAKKTLCAFDDGSVPPFWEAVKAYGPHYIDACVLISIIYSHHILISTLTDGRSEEELQGEIRRGGALDGKAFTNVAHVLEELRYSTYHSTKAVRYDFSPMTELPGLGELARNIFECKLIEAGWSHSNDLVDECIYVGVPNALNMPVSVFRAWLAGAGTKPLQSPEDRAFDLAGTDTPAKEAGFTFRPGHNAGSEESGPFSTSKKTIMPSQLHNIIQNSLYDSLVMECGKECVGTEVPTGNGTFIDAVTQTDEKTTFYEIKTAPSAKRCIREAIPQLLEYAFWPDSERADELVIVSPVPITEEADRYLKHLNSEFGLRIRYMHWSV